MTELEAAANALVDLESRAEAAESECRVSTVSEALSCGGQMAELEAAADALVELESRAEVAESERDAALAAARSLTPRPGLPAALPLAQRLGPAGAARLDEALQRFRWGALIGFGFSRPAPRVLLSPRAWSRPCNAMRGTAGLGFQGTPHKALGVRKRCMPRQGRATY